MSVKLETEKEVHFNNKRRTRERQQVCLLTSQKKPFFDQNGSQEEQRVPSIGKVQDGRNQ